MKMISAIVVSCLSLCGPISSAPASEWARFRGPNGEGVGEADGVPIEWTDSDIRFRTVLPGDSGCSSPVVWGNRVFLLSANSTTAMRYVVCVDSSSGDVVWQKEFLSEAHTLHPRSSYASSTPAVDDERVYVAWSTPAETWLKAFSHEGEEIWSRDLGRWQSQHGFGTSPIVYGDLLILHNSQQARELKPGELPGESFMLAFNRRTGEEVWRTPLVSMNVCYSVPMIWTPPEGGPDQLICTSTGNGMFSLDPLTGRQNWSLNDGLFSMRTVSSPVLAGGLLFGSTGSGKYAENYIVAVRPGAQPTLAYKLQNSSEFKAPYVPCLIADGELLFCLYDQGFASCLHAATGEVLWTERTGAMFSGSPVRIGDAIYCTDENGVVWVFAASSEYKLLAKNDLGEESRATPAVANGCLYVRTRTHLVCIGGR